MSDTANRPTLQRELFELALALEDYDPQGAFSLREEADFFSTITFRLPVHLKSGRVSIIEATRLLHGAPAGRFLLSSGAAPSPVLETVRRNCLERTLRACLHGLDWRGAEIQVRCDPRELSPEVLALIGSALDEEAAKRRSGQVTEFLLPWRRIPALNHPDQGHASAEPGASELALLAARALGITSPVDLFESALLSLFPTACASRGLKMDDCTTLVRGGGSWAFRVAEAIHGAFRSPVRVELAGSRYRPAAVRPSSVNQNSASRQQGRWESDERDTSSQAEVLILLGGAPIAPEAIPEIKSCLIFHLHREGLTPESENALRDRGIVVVPRLLLSSIEELAADALSHDDLCRTLSSLDPPEADEAGRRLQKEWRQHLLASWERILAKTKEEQCTAHAAALRIGSEALIKASRLRLSAPFRVEPSPTEAHD